MRIIAQNAYIIDDSLYADVCHTFPAQQHVPGDAAVASLRSEQTALFGHHPRHNAPLLRIGGLAVLNSNARYDGAVAYMFLIIPSPAAQVLCEYYRWKGMTMIQQHLSLGDRVRLIRDRFGFSAGTEGTVVLVYFTTLPMYEVWFDDNPESEPFDGCDLELIRPACAA